MTQAIRLLLVDPDPASAFLLQQALESGGFLVHTATDSALAIGWLEASLSYGLLILDCELPAVDQQHLCQLARRAFIATPVLLLCAGATEADRVKALDAGVDDVLVRPFSMAECLARCRALVRRAQWLQPEPFILRCSFTPPAADGADGAAERQLEMLVDEHLVLLDGQPVELTPREFRLLQFLMQHPGRPWSRDELLRRVWGDLEALVLDPKTVDVHIRWLRLKLECDPSAPALITTVRGQGYRCG